MLKNIIIEYDIISTLVETMMSNDISDKIKEIRTSSLMTLYSILRYYEEKGYIDILICNISKKKIEMIKQVTSKTEADKILIPKAPYFNGNEFISDKYNIVEEELIMWNIASLQVPLNEAGTKRYMELFKKIFPKVDI